MTATDTADVDQEPAADDGGMLPPYSAEDAVCPMCQNREAFTWFRPALPPNAFQTDWNGGPRRGGRPKRLERECARCTYQWDEALVADQPGMTVDALAYALDNVLPYPHELDRAVLERMAFKLLKVLHVTARPNHPLWQYSDGRPSTATPEICEVPHATPSAKEACERLRAAKHSKESTR